MKRVLQLILMTAIEVARSECLPSVTRKRRAEFLGLTSNGTVREPGRVGKN